MTPTSRLSLIAAAVLAVLGWAGPASAHTVADVVAVPAGSEATVTLQPGHGCGASPTVAVSIRAPVRGATAGEIDGWAASAVEDEDGTVLEWQGGVLPTDQAGRFPVTFTAPDTPGQLLTFPAVQRCENGEELAWIGGDPAAEYPAPRLLVLPAGSAPAATVDEVPPDAPGRERLVEIVDVDDPTADDAASTAGGGSSGAGPEGSTTIAPPVPDGAADDGGSDATVDGDEATSDGGAGDQSAGDADGTAAGAADAAEVGDDGGGGATAVVVAVILVALAAVAGVVLLRQRSSQAG